MGLYLSIYLSCQILGLPVLHFGGPPAAYQASICTGSAFLPGRDVEPYYRKFQVFCACVYSVSRVFANDPEDLGSTPGRVIPKTLKMVLDTALLNTQQ